MGEEWTRSWRGSRRPPRGGHSSIPSWEKTFCTSVCKIPWENICAAKDEISMYKNIADWDDSAALEAIENAKSRYWAVINGLHTDIPLPDPDMYIDEIDHTATVDPKLVAEFYKKPPLPPPPCNKNKDEDLNYANIPIIPTGWGDAEEGKNMGDSKWDTLIEKPPPDFGWGTAEDHLHTNGNSSNSWNKNGGWGDNNSWDKQGEYPSWGGRWDNRNTEQHGRRNGRQRNEFGSGFLKPRHHVNNYQTNNGYEKKMHVGKPMTMAQWKPKRLCGPMNGQRPPEAAWSWDNRNTEQHGRRNGRQRNEFGSGFLKPRHHVNNYQTNNGYEKKMHVGKPMKMAQWKPKRLCGPMNGQRPPEAAWNWDKSVT